MEILEQGGICLLQKEGQTVGRCRCLACAGGTELAEFCIAPAWRRKGYGSYLVKETLRRTGGYAREHASLHRVRMPADAGEAAFWARFGFYPDGAGYLVRRRVPDLTAVHLAQQFVAAHCPAPRLCIDGTCGNGGDTEFLCRLAAPQAGRVLGFDIQPEACARTTARLTAAGFAADTFRIVCDSHAHLMNYAAPGTADIAMFNFGWLPGAEHAVFSTAESSIPALRAALDALRPGGILSAILYSGKTIGCGEKADVLAWLKALPLTGYTVLVCDFANWADTAPLPCFVLKREA